MKITELNEAQSLLSICKGNREELIRRAEKYYKKVDSGNDHQIKFICNDSSVLVITLS